MYKYLIAWIGLVILAIINGAIREFLYQKHTGEHKGHQISTFTLLILITIYSFLIFNTWNIPSFTYAIYIGLIWLILTLAFEFGFGHFISKKSWNILFREYNIFKGRFWPLILIWTALLPFIYYKFIQN